MKQTHPWKRRPLTFGAPSTDYVKRTSSTPQSPSSPPRKEIPLSNDQSTRTPADEALFQLSAALGRVVGNSRPDKTAALGYLQASLAQTAVQAIITLLVQQNIISREQIDRALTHAYEERFKQLAGSQSAVLMPGPSTKPS